MAREATSGLFKEPASASARRSAEIGPCGEAAGTMSPTASVPAAGESIRVRIRHIIHALILGLGLLVLANCQCLNPVHECDVFTCQGCCDNTGTCIALTAQADTQCGINGFACVDCTKSAQGCTVGAGVCGPPNGNLPDGSVPPDAGVDAGCDQCQAGQQQCDPNSMSLFDVCRKVNGCLRWVVRVCPFGETCSNGQCSGNSLPDAGCIDTCMAPGTSQCDPTNPLTVDVCEPQNGCLQWVSIFQCSPLAPCQNGGCVSQIDGGVVTADAGCNTCGPVGQSLCL